MADGKEEDDEEDEEDDEAEGCVTFARRFERRLAVLNRFATRASCSMSPLRKADHKFAISVWQGPGVVGNAIDLDAVGEVATVAVCFFGGGPLDGMADVLDPLVMVVSLSIMFASSVSTSILFEVTEVSCGSNSSRE